MSKKRADGTEGAKRKKVFKEISWGERKKRAKRSAEIADFDVEGIVFGCPLQDKVSRVVKKHIEGLEKLGRLGEVFNKKAGTLLHSVRDSLANELRWRFMEDDDLGVPEDLIEISLSLLYLFPKLWKTIDRPFSLDELKTLDIDELLSERRGTQSSW